MQHELRPQGRKLERTKTPGVYKRGNRYVVVVRDPSGKQRKHSAATLSGTHIVLRVRKASPSRLSTSNMSIRATMNSTMPAKPCTNPWPASSPK